MNEQLFDFNKTKIRNIYLICHFFLFAVCVSPAANVAELNLQKIALNAMYNISTLGSVEQVKTLLNHKLLDILTRHIYNMDSHEDILEVSFIKSLHFIFAFFLHLT